MKALNYHHTFGEGQALVLAPHGKTAYFPQSVERVPWKIVNRLFDQAVIDAMRVIRCFRRAELTEQGRVLAQRLLDLHRDGAG